MYRRGRLALGALALASLAAACSPVYLHLPPNLAETPLAEDIRSELRWIPFTARLAPPERQAEGDRDLLLFAHRGRGVAVGGDSVGGDAARTLHVPEDRTAVLEQAARWLSGEAELPVLLIVPDGDAGRQEEAGKLQNAIPGISVLSVSIDREVEQAMSAVRQEVYRHDNLAGILMIAGDYGVQLTRVIISSLQNPPPLVLELLFEVHGSRLRRAGIGISGAVVIDLAESLRMLDKDSEAGEDNYMVSRFVRY